MSRWGSGRRMTISLSDRKGRVMIPINGPEGSGDEADKPAGRVGRGCQSNKHIMQFWNTIIHTALLGTDKKQVSPEELGPDLQAIALPIQQGNGSREEQFLQIASVAWNYRRCGLAPLHKEEVTLPKAPAEERDYCTPAAIQVLKDLLSLESNSLPGYWLTLCGSRELLVVPELLPMLLQLGESRKAWREMIGKCGGKRMQWLAGFNPEWTFAVGAAAESVQPAGSPGREGGLGPGVDPGGESPGQRPEEEVWQTGSADERKQLLRQVRQTDPEKAREWLLQTWGREDANTRAELLRQLSVRVGEGDLAFLESLLTDKSKKVKEEATVLLKMIPGSAIIQAYWEVLRRAIRLKGKTLQVSLPADIAEAVFSSGIGKLSNVKTVSDEQYILAQLIAATPPQFWETELARSPGEIVGLFGKTPEAAAFTEALAVAAGKWGDRNWAPAFLEDDKRFYPELLPLLPAADRENYLLRNFAAVPEAVIGELTGREEEWSLELTRLFFGHAARNPHVFSRGWFNQHIHWIPTAIAGELDKFTSPEVYQQSLWVNIRDHVSRLLTLKYRTFKAFNE